MEKSNPSKELNPQSNLFITWDYYLGSDITELILSHLSIPSLIRATSVCKLWYSIIISPSFSTPTTKKPWLFLYTHTNIAFAFDPETNLWIKLPTKDYISIGSNGYIITTTLKTFRFAKILNGPWIETSPLRLSMFNPLVGVLNNESKYPLFIVVGGVNIEDRLAVEIYNPEIDSWDLCQPLPAEYFRSGNSSQWLSSALFRGKFYVFERYSCFISSFDLNKRFWSEVQTLRPPGMVLLFLISCQNWLVLAGLCNGLNGESFNLWQIDEKTMEFSEIAIMPKELLNFLFDSSDEDVEFTSLKCVGMGNIIYVFNEERQNNYPACFCEISGESGNCSWRMLPNLPVNVNRFDKTISFCSTVSMDNIFGNERKRLVHQHTIH